jgi:hypothetical protein
MSNVPRRNGIVRAATRPQLGFLAFAQETALGVFLKNQPDFVYSMTILGLSMVCSRDYVALISMNTESASRFAPRTPIITMMIACLSADVPE